jgi:hypothetical protein
MDTRINWLFNRIPFLKTKESQNLSVLCSISSSFVVRKNGKALKKLSFSKNKMPDS